MAVSQDSESPVLCGLSDLWDANGFTSKEMTMRHADCGCQPVLADGDGQDWTLSFCQLHGAAETMRKALEEIVSMTKHICEFRGVNHDLDHCDGDVFHEAEQALAAAGKSVGNPSLEAQKQP